MRTPIAAATAAALLAALVGCAASGTFQEPVDETSGMITEALADLATRPVLHFQGDVDGYTTDLDATDLDVTVTSEGTAYGTVHLGDHDVEVMQSGDEYYARASREFWEATGHSETAARRIDDDWARTYPNYWFSPAYLTAAAYAESLEDTLESTGAMFAPLPEPTAVDGVDAYVLPVEDKGRLYISAAEPHTVLRVETVDVAVIGWTVPLTVDIAGTGKAEAEELRDRLISAAGELDEVYDPFAYISVDEDDSDYGCTIGGTCHYTAKATVDSEVIGYGPAPAKVLVVLSVAFEFDTNGTFECTGTEVVEPGGSGEIGCTTKDRLPEHGVDDWFDTYPQTQGIGIHEPDGPAFAGTVEGEFEGILPELS